MRYAIWFLRLVFAAWMIPAGLNHFFPLFPQPMGAEPLSQELIAALIDSDLFAIIKVVELIAGVCILMGRFVPLALVACMPISFGVWYWDTPLEGWFTLAAAYGWATLGCNVLLCLAYLDSYKGMFAMQAKPRDPFAPIPSGSSGVPS